MCAKRNDKVFIGIDVGTGSTRAGVFDASGSMVGFGTHPIRMWQPEEDFAEQSSEDIWHSCREAIRTALSETGLSAEHVGGIGFDATCSLVALDGQDKPVTVSPSGDDTQNVIVWMDHRAIDCSERINELCHDVLKYVGGRISPEMQSPKLMWIKKHLPGSWRRAAHFWDLADFLTYRATGVDVRSLCTTVCKWTYQGHVQNMFSDSVGSWDRSYWSAIGLDDLVDEEFARIGRHVRPLGEAVGSGLTAQSAADLGLLPGTPVGVGMIDAHAGGIGVLGISVDGGVLSEEQFEQRLALIGGTSSCHMAVAREPFFVPGVWGPYYSAMIPGMWLTEGGQSATGSLVDHVIFTHSAAQALKEEAAASGETVYSLLNARLEALACHLEPSAYLTQDVHVLPYFHGNRSPRADASLRGMISGLKMASSPDDLAVLYLATVQAIAHGTKHIIDTLNAHGYCIETIFACGGGTKNSLFLREHADITGCRIVLPREPEAVLLGSAILGAVASGAFGTIVEAMAGMNGAGGTVEPATGAVKKYHEAKHGVFHKMYEDFMEYRRIMESKE